MPLTGSFPDRIRELVRSGTAPRKTKLQAFLEDGLNRTKKGKKKEDKTFTEPVRLSFAALQDAITKAAERAHKSPSDAQRKAGNYRMGHVRIQGMDITIESPTGSVRKHKNGETVMKNHYGYIKRTESEADGDHIDVFIGPHPQSEVVFIIDQYLNNKFDEHKCMVGFTSAKEARDAYHDNYSPGWEGYGDIRPLTVDQFKKWVTNGDTHRPIMKQVLTFNSVPVKLDKNTDLAPPSSLIPPPPEPGKYASDWDRPVSPLPDKGTDRNAIGGHASSEQPSSGGWEYVTDAAKKPNPVTPIVQRNQPGLFKDFYVTPEPLQSHQYKDPASGIVDKLRKSEWWQRMLNRTPQPFSAVPHKAGWVEPPPPLSKPFFTPPRVASSSSSSSPPPSDDFGGREYWPINDPGGLNPDSAPSLRFNSEGDMRTRTGMKRSLSSIKDDFIDPDMLYAGYYGHPLETFVARDPSDVYRAGGHDTHYMILHNMAYDLGNPEIPKDRSAALDEPGWVLGRTGMANGQRVTSFWNRSNDREAVKAYVLQQIKEGRLHPHNDLIYFSGVRGMQKAGEFSGYSPEITPQQEMTPEEQATRDNMLERKKGESHFKAELAAEKKKKLIASGDFHFGSMKVDRLRDALRKAGLLAPGQNPRFPYHAQRPGNPLMFTAEPEVLPNHPKAPTTRPLPGWVPQENPDADDPSKTGWVPVQSSWIAGLKYTRERGTEMTVKKGGKNYTYPGFNLDMFRRWVAAQSKGKFWWRNIGYPMKDAQPAQFSRFTGVVHPLFDRVDGPIDWNVFNKVRDHYTPEGIMDWAKRHINPYMTPQHLSALIGWVPGAKTSVHWEGPLGHVHHVAGDEPTSLTFNTYGGGYNAGRTLHSRTLSPQNVPDVHNEHVVIEDRKKPIHRWVNGRYVQDFESVPSAARGITGPNLLRQMRAAHEMGIPKIHWYAAWNPMDEGGPGYFTGGLHWPELGADGLLPEDYLEHRIPPEIVEEARQLSGGRFPQSRLFSDFFKSPQARSWYATDPTEHKAFVDTTPGSYSRTNIERQVSEKAALHGFAAPHPDQALYQIPHAEAAQTEKQPEPTRFQKMLFARMYNRRMYHEALEHLIQTGSLHPNYYDEYFTN